MRKKELNRGEARGSAGHSGVRAFSLCGCNFFGSLHLGGRSYLCMMMMDPHAAHAI